VNPRNGYAAALEALADTLGRDEWVTVLTVRGLGHTPRLHVTNRSVPDLASDVYAEAGWFWWPHAERITRTGDPAAAALLVAQTLGASASAAGLPPGPGPLPRRVPPDRPGPAHRIPPDTPQAARR
jgi:hypothetical protein